MKINNNYLKTVVEDLNLPDGAIVAKPVMEFPADDRVHYIVYCEGAQIIVTVSNTGIFMGGCGYVEGFVPDED